MIETHFERARPVPDRAYPALGVSSSCAAVEAGPSCQDGDVVTAVPLVGRHVANAAVTVLVVVPMDEAGHPRADVLELVEARRRRWPVLQRLEDGLDVGVVVTDVRAAEGRRNAEPAQNRIANQRIGLRNK